METERVPNFDEMMQPLLEALKELETDSSLEQLRTKVAQMLHLTPQQLSIMHKPGSPDKRSRFEYNLAWTCTYLKNSGYIANIRRGKWSLTEQGWNASKLDVEHIKRSVRTYRSGKSGDLVTIPESQEDDDQVENLATEPNNVHTEIQWLLLKLGQDMRLDVWIAINDRGKEYGGNKFAAQPRLLKKLPQRFDEATQKTVELIDVLWLKGQAIVAAFEIENTTSIYSGLLRLSDLVSMQPDIDTPLYIVAPDERQQKVFSEINRPTFSKATNLAERCGYISYSRLHTAVSRAEGLASHLAPSFIDDYSERIITDQRN
jgi:hypothetical protein